MFFFLHCVDSHLERGVTWHSLYNLGPFGQSSGIQTSTRLRRSLLKNLRQTLVAAIEMGGAQNEFSRILGVYDNVLDLLFRFRKISLHAACLRLGETLIVPFLFFGPGNFHTKDILLPVGIQCTNQNVLLTTISQGNMMRGHLLICKRNEQDLARKKGDEYNIYKCQVLEDKLFSIKYEKYDVCRFLGLGFKMIPVGRVGFRIELIKSRHENDERVILEIITNSGTSPRQALENSTKLLVNQFIIISERRTIRLRGREISNFNKPQNVVRNFSKRGFPFCFYTRGTSFREPLGLDLRNLDLKTERHNELKNFGFSSIGQILETFSSGTSAIPPFVKKQTRRALFQRGFYDYIAYDSLFLSFFQWIILRFS